MITSINQNIIDYLRSKQNEMSEMLFRLVHYESPSDDKTALDKLGKFLTAQLSTLNANVEIIPQASSGDHLLVRWGRNTSEKPQGTLMLCHMDTVWELGTLQSRPVRIENGMLFGPGAEDMKGGIVIAFWAIKTLQELALFPEKQITLLINSDEETGSTTSRQLIEELAVQHEAVFVLEPPEPPGSYKTQRKGVGQFRITATGRSAHAGADHKKGINAIEEIAHQIITVQGFTDYVSGTTFSAGIVQGGTRSNVVPEKAWVDVDVRVVTAAEEQKVVDKMKSLQPHIQGARIEVSGSIERPPMERTAEIGVLFNRAKLLANEMGIPLSEASTGGASDGNFTAALGIPTLDGMGVVGEGAHSPDEYALLASLPERAAILAALLRSI
jgi:glutamate carboxypeptidase